ncbi:MAG: hypothetical protein KGL43_04315 [Burkholderiales bacterium]|nr:hypothetical protein [Burkholderiales bacterium]MDE2452795.1 hypothetical protein [Burkholderiales bacterium]
MAQTNLAANPFMLMLNPELVLAAVEKSERLGALNRHLCRPLDRLAPGQGAWAAAQAVEDADLEGDESEADAADPTQ